ncbi:NAD(P)-binding protein [Clavulina sp. PMI_390]|nr:NAD(P)-binding protein [Clavulina sp. PMI_390]
MQDRRDVISDSQLGCSYKLLPKLLELSQQSPHPYHFIPMSKIIAVIGATGAQGSVVVRDLLKPSEDGSPSPWKVRALTRNAGHHRAKELEALGAELVEGSFLDFRNIHKLFEGAYGAFVNTDSFTVGADAELNAAFNIWEIAKLYNLRHYIWSDLDHALRLGNWDPLYNCDHYMAKSRFGEFLMREPNPIDGEGMLWTSIKTGPYMDMLDALFAPHIMNDGTRIFISPLHETSRLPLIALDDIAWWVRHTFDNPKEFSGRPLALGSDHLTQSEIVETFKRVTGLPAESLLVPMDRYFAQVNGREIPVAFDKPQGKSYDENFRACWAIWRDGLVKRDFEWIRSVHEPTTLEKWMKERKWDGSVKRILLKNAEDHWGNIKITRATDGKVVVLGY